MIKRLVKYLIGSDISNELALTRDLILEHRLYPNINPISTINAFHLNWLHDYSLRCLQLTYAIKTVQEFAHENYGNASVYVAGFSLASIFGIKARKERKTMLKYAQSKTFKNLSSNLQ